MPYRTRRYLQQSSKIVDMVPTETKLPIDRPVANYYRQSSDGQIGNISTTMQTVNMVAFLERLGWDKSNVVMIDMDAGVSGTTKIDEREGMALLYKLINQGKIGAVACQDEDRLFRDVTQIQVNIFIEACKSNNVLVITPSVVYDFANRTHGSFYARQFRFKSEIAADYIEAVVLGKLYAARRSMFLEGRWAGSSVPTGYMVDMRKKLPDGSKNENWRRYEVFEPYAAVVREYFHIFLSYSGNLTKTLFHIRENGPYYPSPALCPPPDGYKVLYRIRPNKYGWCPNSKSTLAIMFSNALYLGHFVFGEAVIQWNNHPPLIDEETFFAAFNYLSATDLEGNDNPDFRPDRRNHRPSKEAPRDVEYPLLSGLIFSEWEGKLKPVGTNWRSKYRCYAYIFYVFDGFTKIVWNKTSNILDRAVTSLMLDKLQSTFDFATWEKTAESFDMRFDEIRHLKEIQLGQLKTVMENYIVSLSSLTTPQMIAAVEKKYMQAQAEHNRVQSELETILSQEANAQRIRSLLHSFSDVVSNWQSMTADEKRQLCHIFIDRIEAAKSQTAVITAKIFWKDGSVDEMEVTRLTSHGTVWLPQETARLIELVESGASKLEIAKEFPDRTWYAIYRKYKGVVKKGRGYQFEGTIRKTETYNDYIARVNTQGDSCISSDGSSCRAAPHASVPARAKLAPTSSCCIHK